MTLLNDELTDIWIRRRDVLKALLAAEGDHSENAENVK